MSDSVFHEIYGVYFQTISRLLTLAVQGTLTPALLDKLVRESAFEESGLSLNLHSLRQWQLLDAACATPLERPPEIPLTLLQKRWLKTLLSDPRMALFEPDTRGLEGIEPLYTPDMLCFFDRYADGDPYEDPGYIRRFRCMLRAIREKRCLRLEFLTGGGRSLCCDCRPCKLEYSPRDDKFRLYTAGDTPYGVVNLARVISCTPGEPFGPEEALPRLMQEAVAVLRIRDTRQALERVVLHFSAYRRELRRLEEDLYEMTLYYDPGETADLLIRLLSFGPAVQVTAPEALASEVKARLLAQLSLLSPD